MIVADFRREYNITPEDMYVMPTLHFMWYLNGLSDKSNWHQLNEKKQGGGSRSRHGKR